MRRAEVIFGGFLVWFGLAVLLIVVMSVFTTTGTLQFRIILTCELWNVDWGFLIPLSGISMDGFELGKSGCCLYQVDYRFSSYYQWPVS